MKRFSGVLLALAVLAASCSSDPPTAPADDLHPQYKATLLPANEVPAIVGRRSSRQRCRDHRLQPDERRRGSHHRGDRELPC